MSRSTLHFLKTLDITLLIPVLLIVVSGLLTMSSFQGDDIYFAKQGIWILVSLAMFFFVSSFEYRFLKQTRVVVVLYCIMLSILML
jgi:cell division protein FtsW (lipid II flippase)